MTTTAGDPGTSATRTAHDLQALVGRLRRRLHETVDNQELSASQVSVLSRLAKGGPASASDLATAERVRPQSMAATVSVLRERGLVRRAPDPDDGRRQVLSLSPDGQAFFDGRRRSSQQWLARALAEQVSAEELRTVAQALAILERLVEE